MLADVRFLRRATQRGAVDYAEVEIDVDRDDPAGDC
jgi:hypothetical protein